MNLEYQKLKEVKEKLENEKILIENKFSQKFSKFFFEKCLHSSNFEQCFENSTKEHSNYLNYIKKYSIYSQKFEKNPEKYINQSNKMKQEKEQRDKEFNQRYNIPDYYYKTQSEFKVEDLKESTGSFFGRNK